MTRQTFSLPHLAKGWLNETALRNLHNHSHENKSCWNEFHNQSSKFDTHIDEKSVTLDTGLWLVFREDSPLKNVKYHFRLPFQPLMFPFQLLKANISLMLTTCYVEEKEGNRN